MRKFWNAFKILAPTIPFMFLKNSKTADEEADLTPQIQTTVDKIFLTSEPSQFSDLKIFAFDAEILGKEVVSHLDTTLGRHSTSRFNDGEISIQILDAVRGHKVFILKSFENKDINDGVMELILAVSCMKKSGAASVTAIIPFFPYSTASSALHPDQITEGIDFHTCFASDIVKMLENVGCDEIITLNSEMTHPKGFAHSSTFINIDAPEIAVPYLIRTKLEDPVLVGTQSTQKYLQNIHQLYQSFKLFDYKCDYGVFSDGEYIGKNVDGRDVVLYNNFVRTGHSIKRNVKNLKKMGAKSIYCIGFHGLCSNDLFDDLIKSLPIEELIMTNTIFHANENKKIRMISVAKLLAEIITIMYDEKSLSEYRSERQMLNYAYLQKIKSINKEKHSIRKKMEQL